MNIDRYVCFLWIDFVWVFRPKYCIGLYEYINPHTFTRATYTPNSL